MLETLNAIDVIGPAEGFMERNGFALFSDGKIRSFQKKRHFKLNSSWINVRIAEDRNCFLWHIVYFQVYRIISRNCFHCWKITTSPKTLKDLLAIYDLQQKMGLPSKCGIERRPFAQHKAVYNAFWYAPMKGGLEEARNLHKNISLKVKDVLGVQTPVILKRGCTEMENAAGPSNLWEYTERQRMFEDLLEATWDLPRFPYEEPSCLVPATMKKWIFHAIEHQDPTAKDYYKGLKTIGITPTIQYQDTKQDIKSMPEITYLEALNESPRIQRL